MSDKEFRPNLRAGITGTSVERGLTEEALALAAWTERSPALGPSLATILRLAQGLGISAGDDESYSVCGQFFSWH